MWTGRPESLQAAATQQADDIWHRLDEFMDEFYLTHPDKSRQQMMIEDAPPLFGDAYLDGLYAAIGEHLALRWGLSVPAWTNDAERLGDDLPTFVPDLDGLQPILLVESPYAFRRRNIFTNREPLQRARWPQDVEKVQPLGGQVQ